MELQSFILSLLAIFVGTRVMVELATRIGQSAVLGELAAGILIGGSVLGWVEPTLPLRLMGEIGVMLLLFEVGLKSDLHSFMKVGWRAVAVAAIGVATPFALGYGFALVLQMSHLQAIFIGATLTATSVGFSARVLHDLGKLTTPEGNIILGAAVIDDVLGLVILSVIMGLAESGAVSWLATIRAAVLAFLFLGVAILIGIRYGHWFTRLVNRMNSRGKLIVAAMVPVLLFGYVAELLHVAALIGAFAAGLVLARTEHHAHIEDTIKPVADIFVPIFFVLIGAAMDLGLLNPFNRQNWPILMLAAGLTVAAVLGKLAAGLGAGRGINRWAVGIGMLPRGEVGLIFAGVGLSAAIISTAEYGAILLVVTLTTMLSPLLLKRCFRTA
jgi:Kef-type K+ transport system membrane component KefB